MVSREALRNGVGILGNIIALGVFISPWPTFKEIYQKKSVEDYSATPYLSALINCMFWISYGATRPHSALVVSINGAGFVIELVFVLMYLRYSGGNKRRTVLCMLLCEFLVLGCVLLLLFSFIHSNTRRAFIIGNLCVVFGTAMYFSPLCITRLVIKTKSVKYMPLYLSIMGLANGICWTAYSLITRFDIFITIPNGLGVFFSVIQLVVYGLYYKSTEEQNNEAEMKSAEDRRDQDFTGV